MTPSLLDIMRDWIKQFPGWFVSSGWPIDGKRSVIVYRNLDFSSIAVYFWDDKAMDPEIHTTTSMYDYNTHDFNIADPEFFNKIRKVMDAVELRWQLNNGIEW